MSVVQWIRKKPRLSTLIDQPGGVTVRKALNQAKVDLEPMRAEAMSLIDGHIKVLEALVVEGMGQDRAAYLRKLYEGGTGVLDSAGPFDLEDVCSAAYSLCELVDRYERTGVECDERAVAVHVQSLRLLVTMGSGTPEARLPVLEGLQRVLARVPT